MSRLFWIACKCIWVIQYVLPINLRCCQIFTHNTSFVFCKITTFSIKEYTKLKNVAIYIFYYIL